MALGASHMLPGCDLIAVNDTKGLAGEVLRLSIASVWWSEDWRGERESAGCAQGQACGEVLVTLQIACLVRVR